MQKKIICLIVIVLVLLGINTNALAFDLTAYIDGHEIDEKQVQIGLKVSDLDENPEGINAVSGKVIYDSNVFDTVSITGKNNWSAIYNDEEENENRGKFILITTSGNVTEETDIAYISFKLKSNINNIKTQIKIEQIQTSYQSEIIIADDKIINLEINDNDIKITENKLNENVKNEFKNYTIYTIIAIAIVLLVIILIIKNKEKKTNEK